MDQIATSANPSDAPSDKGVTLVVCSSCRGATDSDLRPRPGEMLGEAVRDLAHGTGIAVRAIECLGNCKRRLSAALLREGCWSYVFGDLTVENAADLVSGAELFATSADGLLPWRGRPDCLKRGLVARIPPRSLLEDPS